MDSIQEMPPGNHRGSESTLNSPIADIVSLESVVNVLIQKGLCTPEELFEEERRRRAYQDEVKDLALVATESARAEKSRNQSWLKRKMSKRRWTRRLGTAFFGWQWKKVKISQDKLNADFHA